MRVRALVGGAGRVLVRVRRLEVVRELVRSCVAVSFGLFFVFDDGRTLPGRLNISPFSSGPSVYSSSSAIALASSSVCVTPTRLRYANRDTPWQVPQTCL